MTHVSAKEIDEMNQEQRETTLEELRDEMLQLRSQQALGVQHRTQALTSRLGGA